jgi:hypothetical protein
MQTGNNLQVHFRAGNHPVVRIPDLISAQNTSNLADKNEGHGSSVTTARAFASRFPDFNPRQFSYFLLNQTRL